MAETPRTLRGGRLLEPQILLYLDGVTVSFDGFKALDTLSLVLEEGELRTIIGPNGAGKTTMMDVITRPGPIPAPCCSKVGSTF